MIRRKFLLQMPHPNYSGCQHWYTLKLIHGGMAVNDAGKIMYLEGTMSAFDFVDTRKWCRRYLDGLCEQLGYTGDKKVYGDSKEGELKLIECEADFWYIIGRAVVSREFTLYLDGKKENIDAEGGEIVDGEIEYVDDDQTESVEQKIENDKRLKKRYLQTYLLAEDDEDHATRVVERGDDKGKAVEEVLRDAREVPLVESVRVTEADFGGNVRGELNELGDEDLFDNPIDVDEMLAEQQGNLVEEIAVIEEDIIAEHAEQETRGLDEKGKGKAILEEEFGSDSDDEDFEGDEDSCDDILDGIIYKDNIDSDVEWMGTKAAFDDGEGSSSPSEQTEDMGSDFDSLDSADEHEEKVIQSGDRVSRSQNPHFEIGMIFSTKNHFKDAVNNISVQEGRSTRFVKNDNRRIYARCKKVDEGCGWHLNVLKVKNEEAWVVRELDLAHTCARQFHGTNAKSPWLAKRFERQFRVDPNRTIKSFRKDAIAELGVYVSTQQAIRARQKLRMMVEGSHVEQYTKLGDYAATLKEKNPDSTVILQCDVTSEGSKFKRFYVCLGAVKKGFKAGCRPWIGVDGCHLSGQAAGVLLTAVGMDPNNDPHPLCYAVVEVENRETWEWFLELVKEDLMGERHDVYTFMSDRQKGLIGAFDTVMAGVEHRFCVRHLHGNMKRAGFRGANFKKLLWRAANATTVGAFNSTMKEIEVLDYKCLEWLQAKHPSEWSKSHFSTFGKCDTLVNNMCEQFNGCLIDARDKPILTMPEWIREYMMSRLQKRRDRAELRWEGRKICERIRMIVGKNMKKAGDCIPVKSQGGNYEVSSFDGSKYVVDLQAHTCDCRRWDLCGIPCKHATSAICAEGGDPEDFVHSCYSVETYEAVYKYAISPMSGEELWEKTGYIPPLPPTFHKKKKKGRPQKERRTGACESPVKKQKRGAPTVQRGVRPGGTVVCNFCGESGHNRLSCEVRKAIEEQPDFPMTEVEEEAEMFNFIDNYKSKPSTRVGRKQLAAKRVHFAANIAEREGSLTGQTSSKAAYNISDEIFATQQPKQKGIVIREPPPMSFHPKHFVGGVGDASKGKGKESMEVFKAGGKKYVTLSGLKSSLKKKKGAKGATD